MKLPYLWENVLTSKITNEYILKQSKTALENQTPSYLSSQKQQGFRYVPKQQLTSFGNENSE
jgi:hypothetical protein